MILRARFLLTSTLLLASCCDQPEPNPYDHEGPYKQLALAGTHTCTLDTAGKVACWKYGKLAETPPPAGPFSQIASGSYHACGVRTDGRIACWGQCLQGACDAPPGVFTAVTVDGLSCAMQASGSVTCWGLRAQNPPGSFRQVDAGALAACGVTPAGRVACWGLLKFKAGRPGAGPTPVSLVPPPGVQGRATQVSVSYSYACARLDTGAIACWGDGVYGQTSVPAGAYASVVAGRDRACALDRSGEVVCWGRPITWRHKVYRPPKGPFVEVDLGDNHACARRADGSAVCWGVDQQSQVSGKRWMLVRN